MDLLKLKTGLFQDLEDGQIAIFIKPDLAFNLNQSNLTSSHHLSPFYYQSLYSMTLHPTVHSSLVSRHCRACQRGKPQGNYGIESGAAGSETVALLKLLRSLGSQKPTLYRLQYPLVSSESMYSLT